MALDARRHLAIFLAAAAVLLVEIGGTRVLSVVMFYHFAFLMISMAMLGLGAPGVWFSLRRRAPIEWTGRLLLTAGWAIPATLALIFWAGFRLVEMTEAVPLFGKPRRLFQAVVLLAQLLPMLLLGAAVCLLLLSARGREIGRLYAADLIGATLSAVLIVPLMHAVPTPLIVAGAGGVCFIAAGLVDRRLVPAAALSLVVLIGVMAWGGPFELHFSKAYRETHTERLYEKWTPTARLTVFRDLFWYLDRKDKAFAWGMGANYTPQPYDQLWLEQDGSAGTPITRFDGDFGRLDHLDWDVTGIAYQLRPPRTVCIIGAGGGRDILTARKAGAVRVDAVEINGHTVAALAGPFREFSGDVYHQPGVRAVVSEGRSHLMRSGNRYDLIQISLIDSWAATSAGAFALSENYLYTVEAVKLYLDRLEPGGVVTLSRWMMGQAGLESSRLALMIRRALRDRGVADPDRHFFIVQGSEVGTIVASLEPFSEADRIRLDAIAAHRGFSRHWPAGPDTPKESVVARVLTEGPEFLHRQGLWIDPVDDDRPFFFQMIRPFARLDPRVIDTLNFNNQSVVILRLLMAVMSALTIALFFLPLLLRRRLRPDAGFWRGGAFFTAIGLSFMLVEAPWIQRFILYLGHPSYSTTVVLAAMLLGMGLGSFASARLAIPAIQRGSWGLPLLLAAANTGLEPLFQATLGMPFAVRIALSLLVLAPSGFLMGFAFPTGMVRFGESHKAWFWALNGTAGVLASVFSLVLSMTVGLTATVWIGVGGYLAACLLLQGTPSPMGATATPDPGRTDR